MKALPESLMAVLLIAFLIPVISGCQKSFLNGNTPQTQLESITTPDNAWYFSYDTYGRVIEDKMYYRDTLYDRSTYEYNQTSASPFKRSHFTRQSNTPDEISYFTYNSSGKKIVDSSIYTGINPFYLKVNLDYSVPGKICVFQQEVFNNNISLNWKVDTVFLRNDGNIDSVRDYLSYSQPATWASLKYLGTYQFSGYTSSPNFSSALSISNSNFFLPDMAVNFGRCSGYDYPWFQMPFVIDCFNSSDYTAASIYSAYGAYTSVYTKSVTYNSDNLPQSVNVTNGYFNQTYFFHYQ